MGSPALCPLGEANAPPHLKSATCKVCDIVLRDILPGMNAGASTSAVPSPIEGLGHSVGRVGRLGIEPGAPNAYPSPA